MCLTDNCRYDTISLAFSDNEAEVPGVPELPEPEKEIEDHPLAEDSLVVEEEEHLNVENETVIKDEPKSPEEIVNSVSPTDVIKHELTPLPTVLPTGSFETLLGVPDDAPLKVEETSNGIINLLSVFCL